MNEHTAKRSGVIAYLGSVAICALSLLLLISLCIPLPFAYAQTENIDAEATGSQKAVEATAEEYNQATARVDEINQQIADNEDQIKDLDLKIAESRELCSASMVDLYKMQRDGAGIITAILSSQDLSTFMNSFYYFNRIQDSAEGNIARLSQLMQEKQDTQAALAIAKEDAEREQERAKRAAELAAYQRREAQKAAEEKARQEAAQSEPAQDESSSESQISQPSSDGANWSQDKATFVRSWASRLDAYLVGSPLAGQGKTFAAAAWDAGIDPRFSAAISEVESSRGASCFLPFNAWGWGSVSWSSWEEAIAAHAYGLARGYGYTVTEEGAKKYAADWEHWYTRVSQEMAKI